MNTKKLLNSNIFQVTIITALISLLVLAINMLYINITGTYRTIRYKNTQDVAGYISEEKVIYASDFRSLILDGLNEIYINDDLVGNVLRQINYEENYRCEVTGAKECGFIIFTNENSRLKDRNIFLQAFVFTFATDKKAVAAYENKKSLISDYLGAPENLGKNAPKMDLVGNVVVVYSSSFFESDFVINLQIGQGRIAPEKIDPETFANAFFK